MKLFMNLAQNQVFIFGQSQKSHKFYKTTPIHLEIFDDTEILHVSLGFYCSFILTSK